MDHSKPKTKRGIRKFLGETMRDVLRRTPSPSTSTKASRATSIKSRSPSPLLNTADASSHARQPTAVDPSFPAPGVTISASSSSENVPQTIVVLPVAESSTNDERKPRAKNKAWLSLEAALRALQKGTELMPPLQSAIGSFISCVDILESAAMNRNDYNELAFELASLLQLLTQHMSRSTSGRMSGSIANIARSIEEQVTLIEGKRSRLIVTGILESTMDQEELDKSYRRIESLFRQLQTDAYLSIWTIIGNQTTNNLLKDLDPARLAAHDSALSGGISRRTCAANTRVAILAGLNHWSRDPSGAELYWMNGMAGTGKTTIACSFAETLAERKQLAASFFCSKTALECRKASRIIPTIAYQLARYSMPFQSALCELLSEDPDASSRNIAKQFEQLLRAPLTRVKRAIPSDLVIVIDALDECDDMREIELFLSILVKSTASFPVKLFITSRPEPEIHSLIVTRTSGSGTRGVLHLHEVEKSLVQADIELYLKQELEFISPTPAQIEELTQRSGSFFIYAATLARSMLLRRSQVDPQRWLSSLLSKTTQNAVHYAAIDGLYAAILEAAMHKNPSDMAIEEIEDVRQVLNAVICAQAPIDVEALAMSAGIKDTVRVLDALKILGAVIYFSESTRLVSILHVSFSEFMFDQARSKSFYCNIAHQSGVLARRCFEEMETQLRFNICGLMSSFVLDSDIVDLDDRVKQNISPALSYACYYWGGHLRRSVHSDSLCQSLERFTRTSLLYWMEVLNLQRKIGLGAGVLVQAKLWLLDGPSSQDLTMLIEDARDFVSGFAISPVSQSTPHIYLSLLPFCSRSSFVFHHYWKTMTGLMQVSGSAIENRNAAAVACWMTESTPSSAIYSPDGTEVAFACGNGTISVRDANDGVLVAGPFQGHQSGISSIAYSPNGAHIVYGTSIGTIQVWDVHKNLVIVGPFQGHANAISSLAFSPDGTHVVSSADQDITIRLWNIYSGVFVAKYFEGHEGQVTSVAYSPGGTCIASGSYDQTIRIWNVQDGVQAISPIRGHTNTISSVVYSPDGQYIASGSFDKTVRIWSAANGALVTGPIRGHTEGVDSIAYSPDGTRIVSASTDETVRVWDVRDDHSPDNVHVASSAMDATIRFWTIRGEHPDIDPPRSEGHTSRVNSISFSPDGTSIASGSRDQSIRVWDSRNGRLRASTSAYTQEVTSVVFSPDGVYLVSGSSNTLRVWAADDDVLYSVWSRTQTEPILSARYSPNGKHIISNSPYNTLQVWDAENGAVLVGPFEGHVPFMGCVNSVAYCPDGKHVVSGSSDMTIRVWDALDGTPVIGPLQAKGSNAPVLSVSYSPDGKHIVSGSQDKTIRIWNADSGDPTTDPFRGHTDWVTSATFSPNGRHIASGSVDATVRVWNFPDGTLFTNPFQGHVQQITSVAYSPDGTQIASCSYDSTNRIWKVPAASRSPITAGVQANSLGHRTTFQTSETLGLRSLSNQNPALGHWTVRRDGWVLNDKALLFWAPPDLADYMPTIHNSFVIAPSGSLSVDYNGVLLGEDWHQCYSP